jgi:hypothetical protein
MEIIQRALAESGQLEENKKEFDEEDDQLRLEQDLAAMNSESILEPYKSELSSSERHKSIVDDL